MKIIKEKILALIGAISTLFGVIGAAIAEFGLCACVLAPILSIAGILTILMGFLSQNRAYFLIIGITLLIISFLFYKKKKICKIHRKKKNTKKKN